MGNFSKFEKSKLGYKYGSRYFKTLKEAEDAQDERISLLRANGNIPLALMKTYLEKIDEQTNENTIPHQVQICSVFGCAKELSRQEKLFGNKCINHQNVIKRGFPK